jgi:hypothetical protein
MESSIYLVDIRKYFPDTEAADKFILLQELDGASLSRLWPIPGLT